MKEPIDIANADPADIIRSLLIGGRTIAIIGGQSAVLIETPFHDDAKFGSSVIRCAISRDAFNALCDRFAPECDKGRPSRQKFTESAQRLGVAGLSTDEFRDFCERCHEAGG